MLMELKMPGLDGARATAAIRSSHPDIEVLMLTTYDTYDTDADIIRAVRAGATGYLLKDAERDNLLAAVRPTSRGEAVLSSAVAKRVVVHMRTPATEMLSSREADVLSLVARGLSNKEIAKALQLSEATVKTHLLHIFAKLGVDDRTAAATEALPRGLIRP